MAWAGHCYTAGSLLPLTIADCYCFLAKGESENATVKAEGPTVNSGAREGWDKFQIPNSKRKVAEARRVDSQ
jgi:hypothetical protein